MPFLGTTPVQGFVSSFPKQSFTPNGSTTVFTLTNPVATANDLEVFVGNVRQEPTTAYTAAGTTLTMSEAPASGLNFYVINKSFAQVTTNTPDNSVSTAKIANDAVTGAKIENNPTIAGNFTVSGTSTLTGQITATGGLAIGSDPVTTLDDYEEGTWSPQLRGGGTNVGTTVHQGFYSKIGNVVHCEFNISRNDSASNNNIMELTGLPFPHRTIPATVGGAWIDNTSGDHKCFIYLPSDSSKIYFVKAGANDSYVNLNEYDNGRYIYAAFTYMTDS